MILKVVNILTSNKMNNLDKQYQALLQDILENGVEKKDRTGTGTISVFGRQIRHKMSEGFPLLTTKKMPFKTITTELLWFLRGDTNIKYLVDNNCHIWDGDAYKNYTKYPLATIHDHHANILYQNRDKGWCMLNGRSMVSPHPTRHLTQEEFINKIKNDDKFAQKWGELGPIYGKQWRKWDKIEDDGMQYGISEIDQIQNLINDLKTNPDSRRLMVNAWNVGELDQMVLPPCHYGFQVYTRELSSGERMDYWFKNNKPNRDVCDSVDESSEGEQHKYFDDANVPKRAISLMWNQRSVDTFLGLPFNIASYGLLLEIIAKEVKMLPDELIGNLGDVHLYSNHIEQANEQLTREPMKLPQLSYLDEYHYLHDTELVGEISFEGKIEDFRPDMFKIVNYQSHPTIKAKISN
jgi:thymidylate synthase